MKDKSHFNNGSETLNLAKIIPIENLKVYLSLFYSVKEFLDNLNMKDLENYSPEKQLKRLFRIKKTLEGTMDSNQLKSVVVSSAENEDSVKMFGYKFLNKVGRPGARALGLLVNMLVYDCVRYSGKKRYALIAGFLHEQGLVQDGFDGESVRKICRTMKIHDAVLLYRAYGFLTHDDSFFSKARVKGLYAGFLIDILSSDMKYL